MNTSVPNHRHLLVGYHGTPTAAAALHRAADLVAQHGRLTVVYVDDARSVVLALAASSLDAPPVDRPKLGERILLDALSGLPGDLPTCWVVRSGRVGRQLARVAREQACSAIVIGGAANRRARLRLFPSVRRQLQAWTDIPIIEADQPATLTPDVGRAPFASPSWT